MVLDFKLQRPTGRVPDLLIELIYNCISLLLVSLNNFKNIMSNQTKTPEDLEFEAKLAKAFYKTTAKNIGTIESKRILRFIQYQ